MTSTMSLLTQTGIIQVLERFSSTLFYILTLLSLVASENFFAAGSLEKA